MSIFSCCFQKPLTGFECLAPMESWELCQKDLTSWQLIYLFPILTINILMLSLTGLHILRCVLGWSSLPWWLLLPAASPTCALKTLAETPTEEKFWLNKFWSASYLREGQISLSSKPQLWIQRKCTISSAEKRKPKCSPLKRKHLQMVPLTLDFNGKDQITLL